MEILAPAGDDKSFFAAINNGANAIYLGLGDFNARSKSTFFTTGNIAEYVKKAHLFGVRIYLTVNTLLRNAEIEKFINFIELCVKANIDAYIVQDFGIAKLLKEKFEGIELHASTQMGIHNKDGALMAKRMGFKRVVLSRETKLEDIIEIKKTGIEVEYFVQGALCVAFSGNCYFSAMLHNKSGNRGSCLQLCRLPYVAKTDDKIVDSSYLLSARDLCLIENLQILKDAGVDSLKIEGRLRRPGYVAQSVSQYRNAVDNLGKKFDYDKIKTALKKAFSRGDFNEQAYLNAGVPDDVIFTKVQNHLGVEIGRVVKVELFKKLENRKLYRVLIKSNHKIAASDGLKFLDENDKEIESIGVGNVTELKHNIYEIFTTAAIPNEAKVYLTLDSIAEQQLLDKTKKLALNLNVVAKENMPLKLILESGEICVEYTSDKICEKAKNAPLTKQDFIAQFSKLGDTDFELKNIVIECDNIFMPKSVLNEIRRSGISKLYEKIIENYEKNIKICVKNAIFEQKMVKKPNFNIFVVNEDFDISKIKNDDNSVFVLSPTKYNKRVIEDFKAKFSAFKNIKIGLNLPVVANGKDIKILDEIVKQNTDLILVANNIYGLKYANTNLVIAGQEMNIFNHISVNHLKELGATYVVGSKEIAYSSGTDKFTLKDYVEFMPAYGKTAFMYLCHCPIKTVYKNTCNDCKFTNLKYVNLKNEEFKIVRHQLSQCYFILLSHKVYEFKDEKYGNYYELNYLTNEELESFDF